MDSKLTLNIDKQLAHNAKKYARSKGRSLSNLVEDYFRYLTKNEDIPKPEVPSRVKSLLGSIKVPDDFDYKKELSENLKDNYLKG